MLEEYEPEALIAMTTKNSIQPSVTYEFYLHVLYKIFNYFFGYPRSNICEKYYSLKYKLEKKLTRTQ